MSLFPIIVAILLAFSTIYISIIAAFFTILFILLKYNFVKERDLDTDNEASIATLNEKHSNTEENVNSNGKILDTSLISYLKYGINAEKSIYNILGTTKKYWRLGILLSIAIVVPFMLRDVIHDFIVNQIEIFRDINRSIINYNKEPISDEQEYEYFFVDQVTSLEERVICEKQEDLTNIADIGTQELFEISDCYFKERNYAKEYEILSYIAKNRWEGKYQSEYVNYVRKHYVDPALELIEKIQYILWARKLLLMAYDRIELVNFPPLEKIDYFDLKSINDMLLFRLITDNPYDFYFSQNTHGEAIQNILNRDADFSKLDYEDLSHELIIFYKYFEAVMIFRDKKYLAAYQMFEKILDESNVNNTLINYLELLKIRCVFWCYVEDRDNCNLIKYLNLKDEGNDTDTVIKFMESSKSNIDKDTIKDDIDGYNKFLKDNIY